MNKTDFIFGSLITICIGIIIYLIIGCIVQNNDVLVKEDSEYLYYKEYTLYNRDSAVYKYHKPIIYDCAVVNKRKSGGYVGVPGKGGHPVVHCYTTFEYNGKRVEEVGSEYYNRFNVGDKLKVKEIFYPHYRIVYIY